MLNDEKQAIRKIFHDVFNGEKNMMTPDILNYFKGNGLYVELSSGMTPSPSPRAIFGVTVIKEVDGEFKRDLDKDESFFSAAEARDYIKDDLKVKIK